MCLHGVVLLIAPGKSLGSGGLKTGFLGIWAVDRLFGAHIICVEYKDQSYNVFSEDYQSLVDRTEQSLHLLWSQPEKPGHSLRNSSLMQSASSLK